MSPEPRVEAIDLADARTVQAEIDNRAGALMEEQQKANDAMAEHERLGLTADSRTVSALNLSSVTGTNRQAGGVLPLNRPALKSHIATALGVRDGAQFKDRSRLYVFGAVSGRGVGMNLMHDEDGGWRNVGLSTDKGGFVGERQLGLALRRGQTQAAISYVREKTHAQILGINDIKDHRAMLSITFTPKVGP
jgi:hypothetical protein